MNNYLKVLIADDEESIRSGLKCVLNWEDLGCKICGEAQNGKNAIEQISNLQPDIVLLDVKMPGMTGLEVMKNISEDTKLQKVPNFIILSGFSDFEYAKTALNFGAKAYLLKPVDEDELEKVVKSVRDEINDKLKLVENSKNSEEMNIKYYLTNLFQNFKVEKLEKLENSKLFSSSLTSDYLTVIFSSKYFPNENKELMNNLINDSFSFFTKEVIEIGDNTVVVFKTTNHEAITHSIQRIAKNFPQRTFITKGQAYKGVEGLLKSYKEALHYIDYLYYINDQPCLTFENTKNPVLNAQTENISSDIDNLIFCIETYSKNKFEEITASMYTKLKNIDKPQSESKQDIIFCLLEIKNKISSKYPERDITEAQTFDIVPKVLEKITYDDTFFYMKNVINSMIENFNFNTTDAVIVKVIAYIKTNYTADLKLENLGEMFNCNSAYLGKKFKKYTGVQFNSYLDSLRIEDAKEKIKNSDLKIYQISKLVGFANTDYFFMKFKKYTGYTPKEYKIITEMEKQKENTSSDNE